MIVGGTGPAGQQVAVAVAPVDREREADAARARGEQAVGQPEVRVGLGEHERRPAQDGGQPDRAGGVAAAAEHRVGAVAAQQARGGAERASAALPTARAAFSGLVREMPSTFSGSSS